jgi:hypothetical protein
MAKTEESATQLGAPEAAPGPAPAGNLDGDKSKGGGKGGSDKPTK